MSSNLMILKRTSVSSYGADCTDLQDTVHLVSVEFVMHLALEELIKLTHLESNYG